MGVGFAIYLFCDPWEELRYTVDGMTFFFSKTSCEVILTGAGFGGNFYATTAYLISAGFYLDYV